MTDDLPALPDLTELLDSSFGDGPPPAAAADRLVPARRALRRRRALSGGGAALGVAAVVTAIALVGGGGDGSRAVQPAAGGGVPSSSSCPDWIMTWGDDAPTDDPCPAGDGGGDGGGTSPGSGRSSAPDDQFPHTPGESTLVRFAGATGDELVARGEATILVQSPDVDLPANFAGPGDRTAIARVDDAGTVVYVLARQIEGSRPEYIATADPRDRWPTIAAFLQHAEKQYVDEVGLR